MSTAQIGTPSQRTIPVGLIQQVEDRTPEPLYESAPLHSIRLCLVCGQKPAKTALQTSKDAHPIVPICAACSASWNTYGYSVLKKIKPMGLLWNATRWFLVNPFQRATVWGDIRRLMRWQGKMDKLRKLSQTTRRRDAPLETRRAGQGPADN